MRQRLPGALLVATGAAIGVEATSFDVAFLTDPVGPKALPLLVSATLVLAGLRATLRPDHEAAWPTRPVLAKLTAATAAFLLYPFALEAIGFVPATTLVVAALSHLYGAPPRRGVPAAAVLAGALWLLFVRVLALPLPIGSLWMR